MDPTGDVDNNAESTGNHSVAPDKNNSLDEGASIPELPEYVSVSNNNINNVMVGYVN